MPPASSAFTNPGIEPHCQQQGLTLTLKVTAYDNWMIEVDGIPINVEPHQCGAAL